MIFTFGFACGVAFGLLVIIVAIMLKKIPDNQKEFRDIQIEQTELLRERLLQEKRHSNALESLVEKFTPANSDYTTAIRIYHQWCESGIRFDFHTWLQAEIQRLHPPKSADDA